MKTFGVEIEFIGKQWNGSDVIAEMNREGLPCWFASYTHDLDHRWKIVTDSSVSANAKNRSEGYHHGLELVSPVLSELNNGWEQLEKACKALERAGAKVNRSCGLHVHHGVRGQDIEFFKKLFYIYYRFEETIDSMMPASRRRSVNSYCRSLKTNLGFNLEQFKKLKTISALTHFMEGNTGAHQMATRYLKLNYFSFLKYSTVEFRHHSGTVDFNKIKHWIILTDCMVERAKFYKKVFVPSNASDSWTGFTNCIWRFIPEETKKFYSKRIRKLARAERRAA